ncbi:(2Fe-2S)-binding protein [Kibdelosporangium lantanae]|uniref:(2Fe-2S)-binding protein n=1 Tax=Kibdelosporangium lantanae TaxID=1497396 RepID=A0ABW3M4Z6_9PSEU
MRTKLTVNGEPVEVEAEPRVLLADLLRDQLGLTGTKVACDTAQCGSCVVRMNALSVKSCAILAAQAEGADVTTIEGVTATGELEALSNALREVHGTQCGFCTPGVAMSLLELLKHNPRPTEQEIRTWLTGTICRCTGYHSIVRAVQQVTGQEVAK